MFDKTEKLGRFELIGSVAPTLVRFVEPSETKRTHLEIFVFFVLSGISRH